MDIKWTDEQQKVINAGKHNILVSAAAGSGKTAVLVERIIQMVLSKDNPIDIDRLLIVTFTEAAASEMRERIGDAIEKKLIEEPDNEHLRRQSALLYKAQISTIHSFCLNVIRNNFNDIGLDPAFRIADETELKLMEQDVMDQLFENKYESGDAEFISLADYFRKGVGDNDLKSHIFKLASLSEGHPWPKEWLMACADGYKVSDVEDFNKSAGIVYVMNFAKSALENMLKKAKNALEICNSEGGPTEYIENIESDISLVESLLIYDDYDSLRNALLNASFVTLSRKSGKSTDPETKELVKKLRDKYKGTIKKGGSGSILPYFERSAKEEISNGIEIYPIVKSIIDVTIEYIDAFKKARLDNDMISFSDMEHLALQILGTSDGKGGVIPTAAALEYRDSFDEIIMDEYQDCNRIQEYLMLCICGESKQIFNRFMVGDIKQSIYKFRMASPELFQNKYDSYQTGDYSGQCPFDCERINLHSNFRSRKNVINTVNNLFSQIMHASLGGVEYDEDAALVCGAKYPEISEENMKEGGLIFTSDTDDLRTEMLLCIKDKEAIETKGEQEALMIAAKIKDIIKNTPVTDKKTGKLRKATYKDIVILLRSMTDVAQGLKTVLNEQGIPVALNLKTGFYETKEIQQIIQFLKILDNPRQDIPLYGTLISFFGGFTDEEIAKIRDKEDKYLFDSLLKKRSENEKVAAFLDLYEDYRRRSFCTQVHILLRELITETHFIEYVTALSGGAQRRANLMMLLTKAAAYEDTSYKGLFHFVRYLKELQKISADEGEADVISDNLDAVRIMTIHKSKGLEFPVCILAGVHKKFNTNDKKGRFVADMDLGIGIDSINTKKRVMSSRIYRKAVNLKLGLDIIGEELRVLYVALTRAKEKLIITGVVNDEEQFIKALEMYSINHENEDVVSFSDLSYEKSYLDMMLGMAVHAKKIHWDELVQSEYEEAIERIEKKSNLLKKAESMKEAKDERYLDYKAQFSEKYPHPELSELIQKTSVSELKRAHMDYENTENMFEEPKDDQSDDTQMQETEPETGYVPKFAKQDIKKQISGTDRGTAYHKIMELCDFNDKDIKSQLDKMIKEQLISNDTASAVAVAKIEEFMKTDLCRRMAEAMTNNKLKREQPFVLGIDANRVKAEFPQSETMLLQGIIDAFFIENGEIVLLDYKTDKVSEAKELVKRYAVQLDYYEEALVKITGLKVKEKLIYSFCLNEVISL